MKSIGLLGKKRAFTLVELLVVIAIIGILAAIVMPAINTALLRGRALKVSTFGRSLYQMLVQSQTEQIYTTTSSSWPLEGTLDPSINQYDTSTSFFKHMVTNRTMNVAFSEFAAPGLPAATGHADFQSVNNAWMITADAEDLTETAPMFFTRNIGAAFDALNVALPFDASDRFNGAAAPFNQPFGNNAFVFTTRGGQSFALIKDDLNRANFENLFNVKDPNGDPLDNPVLQP